MKCRSWMTSSKFLPAIFLLALTPFAALAEPLKVEAVVNSSRGIRGREPEVVRCSARFSAERRENGVWLIKSLTGSWNGSEIHAGNYEFNSRAAGKEPIDRALSMLIPYVAESPRSIRIPRRPGPLSKEYLHELLRRHGFDVEKMNLNGFLDREPGNLTLTIKGAGDGQRIDYRLILDAGYGSKEILFDYKINARMPESDPFAAGLEIESSGKGTVKVRGYPAE